MTRFLSFLVVSFLLAMPARADDAARQVISDQLDAFQQDDFDTAFTHASPMIGASSARPSGSGRWCATAIRWSGDLRRSSFWGNVTKAMR